jgi:hypothetical protein
MQRGASLHTLKIIRPDLAVTMLASVTSLIKAIIAPEVTIGIFPAVVTILHFVAVLTEGKVGVLEAFLTDDLAVKVLTDLPAGSILAIGKPILHFLTVFTDDKIGVLEAILTKGLAANILVDLASDCVLTLVASGPCHRRL